MDEEKRKLEKRKIKIHMINLNEIPQTKSGIVQLIDSIAYEILEEGKDSLEYALFFRKLSELVDTFGKHKDIQDAIVKDSENYGQKEFDLKGVKFKIQEVGVKYDFTNCGHSGWLNLSNEIKSLSERKSDIEKTLKTIKGSTPDLVDAETGEMLKPPAKSSTTKTVLTLPK